MNKMKLKLLSVCAIALTLILLGCNKEQSADVQAFASSDLQMEMLHGDVHRVEVYEFIAKKNGVGLKLKYYKEYDEQGFLLPNGDFDEIRELKEAARYTNNGNIVIHRNDKKQIESMALDASDVWDSFDYTYDSIGTGYLTHRNASYFEAGGDVVYLYDTLQNLVGEKIRLYNHNESMQGERIFTSIKYDQKNNWIFRKVTENRVISYEWSEREKKISKTYYEIRDIKYRE